MRLAPARELDRLERAAEDVVVGDRDRAEALRLGVVEQLLDLDRAVVRPGRVHVEVADDPVAVSSGARSAPARPRRRRGGRRRGRRARRRARRSSAARAAARLRRRPRARGLLVLGEPGDRGRGQLGLLAHARRRGDRARRRPAPRAGRAGARRRGDEDRGLVQQRARGRGRRGPCARARGRAARAGRRAGRRAASCAGATSSQPGSSRARAASARASGRSVGRHSSTIELPLLRRAEELGVDPGRDEVGSRRGSARPRPPPPPATSRAARRRGRAAARAARAAGVCEPLGREERRHRRARSRRGARGTRGSAGRARSRGRRRSRPREREREVRADADGDAHAAAPRDRQRRAERDHSGVGAVAERPPARERGRRRGSTARGRHGVAAPRAAPAATPATCSFTSCGCDQANGVTRQTRRAIVRFECSDDRQAEDRHCGALGHRPRAPDPLRRGSVRSRSAATLPLTTDCSGFVTVCYFLAGAPDPNGLDYSGEGLGGDAAPPPRRKIRAGVTSAAATSSSGATPGPSRCDHPPGGEQSASLLARTPRAARWPSLL